MSEGRKEGQMMVGCILAVSFVPTIGWAAAAGIVGVVVGYAFRGKEQRVLTSLGNDIKKKL